MKIQINNEYECLKKVVVASANYYDPTNLAINNETIKYFAEKGGAPTKEALLEEQKNFWETLRNHNVEVLEAQLVEGANVLVDDKNVFVVNPQTIIMNKNHTSIQNELEKRHLTVISLERI